MSRDDTNLMEGDILSEEILTDKKTDQPKKAVSANSRINLPKLNTNTFKFIFKTIRHPKLIIIFMFFIILIASLSSIILLSKTSPPDEIVDPGIFITTPNPTPKIDKEVQALIDKINKYQKKVDDLSISIKNYPPPKVDIIVDF